MRKYMVKVSVAATLALAASGASAQQCQGFGDVLQSDTLVCPAVEWVKNRAVTVGCGNGSNYCPDSNVTRAQMAIFMQRLGKALSPEVLSQQVFDDGGGTGIPLPGDSPVPAIVRCVTPVTAAVPYPRVALANATFSALSDGSPAGFRAFPLVRANGGSFANFAPGLTVAHRGTAQATIYGFIALTEQIVLQPNTSYDFALGVRRDNNPNVVTTGNFDSLRCQLTVTIENRNGTSSPLDAIQ